MAAMKKEIERTNQLRLQEEHANREADRLRYESIIKKAEEERRKAEYEKSLAEAQRVQIAQQNEELHLASVQEARRLQEENLRARGEEREEFYAKFRDLETQIAGVSCLDMPSKEGLPPSQANNPWFIGHMVPRRRTIISIWV